MNGSAKPLMAALAAATLLGAAAHPPAGSSADQVQEIVVTGKRSGVPMWTVRGETTTLVLVGGIEGVSRTTRWDPAALVEALRKAENLAMAGPVEQLAALIRQEHAQHRQLLQSTLIKLD